MLLGTEFSDIIAVVLAMITLAQLGLTLSALAYPGWHLKHWLSRFTRINEPDLTWFMRRFERFYEELIDPIGEEGLSEDRTALKNWATYQLRVGVVVIAAALAVYIWLSMSMVVVSAGVYATAGVFVDPAPAFPFIVAAAGLGTIAIMGHAQERSMEIVGGYSS